MNKPVFQLEHSVEEILKSYPQTMPIFRQHGTDCVGCFLQRFCTLQDVADTYGLQVADLLGDLEMCTKEIMYDQRSTL